MRVLTRSLPRVLTIAATSAALLAAPGLDAPSVAAPAPTVHAAPATVTTTGTAASTSPSTSSSSASTATSVSAAGRRNTSIRFLDFDHTRPWRLYVYVRGQVVASKGGTRGALKSVRVRLYRKLDSQRRYHFMARTRSGTQRYPRFLFKTPAIGNATYKVVFRGNSGYQPSRGTSRVLVHRSMRSRLEDGSGSFHGFVRPKWNRKPVYLEKRSCASCPYQKVRTTRSGPHGYFRFVVSAPRTGRWWWRASTQATSRFIWSYTNIYTTQLR
jgi:hypothetical protein